MKFKVLLFFGTLISAPTFGRNYGRFCSEYFPNGKGIKVCYNGNILTSVEGIEGVQYNELRLSDTSISKIAPNAFKNLGIFKLILNLAETTLDIQEKSFEGLPMLTSLHIESGIARLENNFFAALSNLRELTLIIDGRQSLAKVFSNLPNLRILKIHKSNLKIIEKNFFSNHHQSITKLNISNNEIEKIPEYFFSSMTNLETLSLSYNHMVELTPQSFDHLILLKNLEINFNSITVIPRDVFETLIQLETLSLEFNQIKTIHGRAFSGTNITRLSLNGNSLEKIFPEMFLGLDQLIQLYLEKNDLTRITRGAFRYLPKLRELSLRDNKIYEIGDNAFFNMSLEYISFWGNNISSIQFGAFEKCTINILGVSKGSMKIMDDPYLTYSSIYTY